MRLIADITQTVTMKAASPLFAESSAPAMWVILTGEVSVENRAAGETATARGGDVVGAITTMAGRPLGRSADVLRGGVALKLERDDLFGLLGERPELLRQIFSGMFRPQPVRV